MRFLVVSHLTRRTSPLTRRPAERHQPHETQHLARARARQGVVHFPLVVRPAGTLTAQRTRRTPWRVRFPISRGVVAAGWWDPPTPPWHRTSITEVEWRRNPSPPAGRTLIAPARRGGHVAVDEIVEAAGAVGGSLSTGHRRVSRWCRGHWRAGVPVLPRPRKLTAATRPRTQGHIR